MITDAHGMVYAMMHGEEMVIIVLRVRKHARALKTNATICRYAAAALMAMRTLMDMSHAPAARARYMRCPTCQPCSARALPRGTHAAPQDMRARDTQHHVAMKRVDTARASDDNGAIQDEVLAGQHAGRDNHRPCCCSDMSGAYAPRHAEASRHTRWRARIQLARR